MTRLGVRLREAARLGFSCAVVSSRERAERVGGLEIVPVSHLDEALALGFSVRENETLT